MPWLNKQIRHFRANDQNYLTSESTSIQNDFIRVVVQFINEILHYAVATVENGLLRGFTPTHEIEAECHKRMISIARVIIGYDFAMEGSGQSTEERLSMLQSVVRCTDN